MVCHSHNVVEMYIVMVSCGGGPLVIPNTHFVVRGPRAAQLTDTSHEMRDKLKPKKGNLSC